MRPSPGPHRDGAGVALAGLEYRVDGRARDDRVAPQPVEPAHGRARARGRELRRGARPLRRVLGDGVQPAGDGEEHAVPVCRGHE
jgi:hypothetical protein